MKKRKELNRLLNEYETFVGAGSMKQAGRLLPVIVRKLVEIVDEATSSDDAPVERVRSPSEDNFGMPIGPISQPCAPCDVSIPNNPKLIDEFKPRGSLADAFPAVEPPPPVEEISEEIAALLRDLEKYTNGDEDIVGRVELGGQHADYTISSQAAAELATKGIDVEGEVREALGEALKRELDAPASPKPSRIRKTSAPKAEVPKTAAKSRIRRKP